jgi:hypothetical protein
MSWKNGFVRLWLLTLSLYGCSSTITNNAPRPGIPLSCAELKLRGDNSMKEYASISRFCADAVLESSDCHLHQQFIGMVFNSCSTKEKYAHQYCEAQKAVGEADRYLWKWYAALRISQRCEEL